MRYISVNTMHKGDDDDDDAKKIKIKEIDWFVLTGFVLLRMGTSGRAL